MRCTECMCENTDNGMQEGINMMQYEIRLFTNKTVSHYHYEAIPTMTGL